MRWRGAGRAHVATDAAKARGFGGFRCGGWGAGEMATRDDDTTASADNAPTTTPGLRLYNTLTRAVEAVSPLEQGHVRMYSCGPTVYRYIHVGNLRTFTMADWIRRALVAQG